MQDLCMKTCAGLSDTPLSRHPPEAGGGFKRSAHSARPGVMLVVVRVADNEVYYLLAARRSVHLRYRFQTNA